METIRIKDKRINKHGSIGTYTQLANEIAKENNINAEFSPTELSYTYFEATSYANKERTQVLAKMSFDDNLIVFWVWE